MLNLSIYPFIETILFSRIFNFKHIQRREFVIEKGHKITNVRPNNKVNVLYFVCGKSI